MNTTYMFESFDEYAELMGLGKNHPNYEKFSTIWHMARAKMPKELQDAEEKETNKKTH